MLDRENYEPVIGLEVHVQLSTKSKIFSSDINSFGQEPNENISAITIAHPGVLPLINKSVVDCAIKMGLALNCDISRKLIFDRKNYFYPDLPKGYQITQDTTPICRNGGLEIRSSNGSKSYIALTKIHLEEDAGKSIHISGEDFTKVDLNRAGVPLIEIVTEPVLKSSDEAAIFLSEIRKIARYLEISDGNMEEGSLRCDANVSIHRKGEALGNKVEVKNMNSFRNVARAIDKEIERQLELKKAGKEIISETRTFNPATGETSEMRTKEVLNDYRYFPEPDISPIIVDDRWIDGIKSQMPALPHEVKLRLIEEFGLPEYDAGVLTEEKSKANYFIEVTAYIDEYKQISNWLMGPVRSYLNDNNLSIDRFPLKPKVIAEIIELVRSGRISQTIATQSLFRYLLKHPEVTPADAVDRLNIVQEGNSKKIQSLVNEILEANPDKVKAYHNGKKGLTGMFMGELMKKSSGKVDPKLANRLIVDSLESRRQKI